MLLKVPSHHITLPVFTSSFVLNMFTFKNDFYTNISQFIDSFIEHLVDTKH